MKYIKTILGVFFATALFATTAVASGLQGPQLDTSNLFNLGSTNAEQWSLSLGGNGATTTSGDSQTAVGLQFRLGHDVTLLVPAEAGLRQGLGWSSTPDKNGGSWLFNTAVYNDWKLLTFKSIELYAGVDAGVAYGNRAPTWYFGPEAEARLWLKKDVFTFFRVNYNFDVTSTAVSSQNVLGYTLGVGFKF